MSIRAHGWTRQVAIPGDLSRMHGPTTGRIRLPLHVYSSGLGDERVWDLDDEDERREVYQIVLTDGTADDVCRLLNLDELRRLWPDLWLPRYVRRAWSAVLDR